MATRYECGWCGQTIKKTMQCGSIYGVASECFWVKRIAAVGLKKAMREARESEVAKGYERTAARTA